MVVIVVVYSVVVDCVSLDTSIDWLN